MDEEAVGLMLFLAIGAQGCRHCLALLARVDEDQAFLPACMGKDIAKPGVCMFRRRIRRRADDILHRNVIAPLPRLRIAHIEMLKGEPPLTSLRLDLRYNGLAPRPRRKEVPRTPRIADGRRESDAARLYSRNA